MVTIRIKRQAPLGKLRPPRLGRVFDREQLFTTLDGPPSPPGVWIAGPPGIGKTTFVATYLQARGVPCLWLQLDAGDADPATFVHFLRAAATLAAPRLRLRLPLPTADDLRDVPGFIRRCFRRLVAALDMPWVLVLDNTQELGSAPLIHAGLAAALEELPEHARLIAISRELPPCQYVRMLASQRLVVVEGPLLRFTEDDTRRLVDLHGRSWQPSLLLQVTDGWPAAMILLLATRTDLSPHDAIRHGTARDRLFAFFAGEVMEKFGRSDAAALTRIAFLPSATAAMAVAISGEARAGELLADLARRSLFTDRRDGAPTSYTFHALFGEFLRGHAVANLDAPSLLALRVSAAGILSAHGDVEGAMSSLISAAAWPEALALLVGHAGRFAAQARTAVLRDWLLALPEASRDEPHAWYWLGYCELGADPAHALVYLERAHRGFVASANAIGSFHAAAAAADAIVFLGASLDALEPWMPVLESNAAGYLAHRDVDIDMRVLPGLLAAFVHRETAHPLTAALADLAERMLSEPRGASQRLLLGALAYYLLWTGQPARLDRIIAKIDRMCAGLDTAPATLLRWHNVGVLIRSLLGRVDEALLQARRALAIAAEAPAPLQAKAHLSMAIAAIAARNAELARAHLAQAAGLLDPGNAVDATTYEFQRGLLMLLDGDWSDAAALMRLAVASGRASGWALREHIALLGQALAATQLGAFEEAETALQAALTHRFHAVCRWHHWIAALIEAHLAKRLGDRGRCLDALSRAFAVGRQYGYDFGPMPYACGDMMSGLAALALDHGIDVPFATRIVRRYGLPAPPQAGERWPWPIRIRTLGHFSIEYETAPAAASRKQSKKPLDLLKLLIALGGKAVPAERLHAALWPEAEGDAARNSFDNTLHRLRKMLGADRYLTLEAGSLSLDTTTCWVDLAALECCLAEVDRLSADTDTAVCADLAERALRLCPGEFLAGEDVLPDLLAMRARLQASFSRQMVGLSARLESAGRHATAERLYARVLEQQPLAEDISRRLIACLLARGHRAEAYEVYRRCRQQLSVVLGIRPAAETEALVASLRDL